MPSPKQIKFIEDLLAEKDVAKATGRTLALLEKPIDDLTGREPSWLIDDLIALPKKAKPVAVAGVDKYEHLRDIVKSNYALTWEQLHTAGVAELTNGNKFAYFSVKPWKDRVFLDQLHGAPGSFNKTQLTKAQEVAVASLIKADPLAAGLLFSQKYTVCARCSSELTDDRSIDTGYGPTCRGYMGL